MALETPTRLKLTKRILFFTSCVAILLPFGCKQEDSPAPHQGSSKTARDNEIARLLWKKLAEQESGEYPKDADLIRQLKECKAVFQSAIDILPETMILSYENFRDERINDDIPDELVTQLRACSVRIVNLHKNGEIRFTLWDKGLAVSGQSKGLVWVPGELGMKPFPDMEERQFVDDTDSVKLKSDQEVFKKIDDHWYITRRGW